LDSSPVSGRLWKGWSIWKLVRSFMQTDLLAPQSANRYLPGILEATRFISKGICAWAQYFSAKVRDIIIIWMFFFTAETQLTTHISYVH
jgi:hypothetical protein